MILEKRRNGKFAKKMQPVYRVDEPVSLFRFNFVLACVIELLHRSDFQDFRFGGMGLSDRNAECVFV